ncbi:MAG: hypothetical protein OEV37_00515 [Candidatus Berkelbacteria bacterium]|nr:hypothetical protein [Candidatus Berkelbacteria bacterium]
MEFSVINLSWYEDDPGLKEVVNLCQASIVLRNSVESRAFPRDLGVAFPGLALFNSRLFPQKDQRIGNTRLATSRLGEGGAVLSRAKTALVSHTIGYENGEFIDSAADAMILIESGIKTQPLPNPICRSPEGLSLNDHLDRTAGLVEDSKGNLHLVVDPQYHSGTQSAPISPAESADEIRRRCEHLSIAVHTPRRLAVPFSVGVCQLPNGKILATSGDDVEELLAGIVGEDRVVTTDIPLECYPAFVFAGIHCLVTELPRELCEH